MRRCFAPGLVVGLCLAMSGQAWAQAVEQAPNEPRKPGEPQGALNGAPPNGQHGAGQQNPPHHGPHQAGPHHAGPHNPGPRFDLSKLSVGTTITRQSEQEARIRKALESPAVFELKETTLGDLVTQIQEKYKISVVLDVAALTADGYGTETILKPQVREISLRGGLHTILDSGYTMTVLVHNDALYITTKTAAETITPTRIYQVHDLVIAPNQPDGRPDFNQLTDLITATIYPESWREAGGTQGEIKGFEAAGVMALVVTHTYEIHDQIEQLLASLREAKTPQLVELQSRRQGPPPAKGQPFVAGISGGVPQANPFNQLLAALQANNPQLVNQQPNNANPNNKQPNNPQAVQQQPGPHNAPPVGPPHGGPRFDLSKLPDGKTIFHQSAAEKKVRAALDAPAGFKAGDTTLGELVKQIAEKHQISVVLYEAALAADGKDAATELVAQGGEGLLRSRLRTTLDELALTAVVRDDALLITTKLEAETVTPTRIYQVHDLIVAPSKPEAWPEFDVLSDVIMSIIAPETWREAGGTQGEIKPFEGAGMMALVVTQTDAVHEQIEELVTNLRAAKLPDVAELQSHRQGPPPGPPIAPWVGGVGADLVPRVPPANPQPTGTAPSDAPKRGGNFFRVSEERSPAASM